MSLTKPNIAAVIPTAKARVTIQERPVPTPSPNELLILNHAISACPAEWRIQDFDFLVEKYPNVLGSDICGVIVSTGSAVTRFKIGDRVSGFAAVIQNSNIDHGAWQTYTLLKEIAATRIPDSMSFEEGSVFPMGFATAASGFFLNLQLPKPSGANDFGNSVLLIWSASGSVGCCAVQLAKEIGIPVYAVCSAKNHEYVKSLGASKTFDYHDKDVVAQIVQTAKENGVTIDKAFDAISEHSSMLLVAQVLAEGAAVEAEMATVNMWPDDEAIPSNVEVSMTFAKTIVAEKEDLGAWFFNEWLKDALEEKRIIPAPKIEIVEGGIEVAQMVYDRVKAGVSATKLVVQV